MEHERISVSTKGQIVIPKDMREILGIHSGMELICELHDDSLLMRPVKRDIKSFFGCCSKKTDQKYIDIDSSIMNVISKNDRNAR